MSSSATPAFFKASITAFIAALFFANAACAVGASDVTPEEMVAMSGRTLTSPVPDTVTIRGSDSSEAERLLRGPIRAAAAIAATITSPAPDLIP